MRVAELLTEGTVLNPNQLQALMYIKRTLKYSVAEVVDLRFLVQTENETDLIIQVTEFYPDSADIASLYKGNDPTVRAKLQAKTDAKTRPRRDNIRDKMDTVINNIINRVGGPYGFVVKGSEQTTPKPISEFKHATLPNGWQIDLYFNRKNLKIT